MKKLTSILALSVAPLLAQDPFDRAHEKVREAEERAHEKMLQAEEKVRDKIQDKVQEKMVEVNDRLWELKERTGNLSFKLATEFDIGLWQGPPQGAGPKPAPFPRPVRRGRMEGLYQRGMRNLDERHWDSAVDAFNQVASEAGDRADAALYWKAYALNKLGRRDEALAAIEQLRKSYASSRWLEDAKALELEARQSAGQKVSPETESDEDLKLLAINGLVHSDPDRALPLLDKILKGSNSPRLKERAIFVLAQSDSPQARQRLLQMAQGGANPDLQVRAIRYLRASKTQDTTQALASIYGASQDIEVRREILHGFGAARDRDRLLNVAKNDKAPELRREAIQMLAGAGGASDLAQLYAAETDTQVKSSILHALMSANADDKVLELTRSEKDPNLRREAAHLLTGKSGGRSGETLLALYNSEQDAGVRREIINALAGAQNVKALIDLARKESNVDLKKHIVGQLSRMRSKEASDYLVEILNK